MPTPNAPRSTDTSFGFESLLEAQTRLWNQMLDANRSFWSFYAPWMPVGAWGPNNLKAADDPADAGTEPATTAAGIPDPLEMQTRSWNHFLDAQRTFWTALNWPVPPTPWSTAANEDRSTEAKPTHVDKKTAKPRRSSR
jgi:hypothetical protein